MADNLSWLAKRYRPKVLIDIGANDGAYGLYLKKLFGVMEVHVFEPQPKHRESLISKGFIVHSVALADKAGEASFYTNTYDSASSLLPITDICRTEYPKTADSQLSMVQTARLDDELPVPPQDSLIKIDAQGYELPIIQGGRQVVSRALIVLIEMSFQRLYEGQSLFNDVHSELDALGFELAGFLKQYAQESTGQPLFAHCAYIRRI